MVDCGPLRPGIGEQFVVRPNVRTRKGLRPAILLKVVTRQQLSAPTNPLDDCSLVGQVRQIVWLDFRRIIGIRRQRPDMPGAVGAHLPHAEGHARLALQLPDDAIRVACRCEDELKIGFLKFVGRSHKGTDMGRAEGEQPLAGCQPSPDLPKQAGPTGAFV